MSMVIVGLILGIACIFGSFLMEGGKLSGIILIPAMMIVFGGTAATAIIGTPRQILFQFPTLMRLALFPPEFVFEEVIKNIVEMAGIARREGILSLEQKTHSIKNRFFKKMLTLAVDGVDPQIIQDSAQNEINYLTERHNAGASIFQKMGGYSPTMGIIGTVLGLISTLANAGEDANELIRGISTAFIATLWGVFMANIVWLPIADRLKSVHNEEKLLFEIITEGVCSLQSGDNPSIIQTKLNSMLPGKTQEKHNKVEEMGSSSA